MKKIILILILFVSVQSYAHYLWVETSPIGQINQEQEIHVYFGEYTHGLIEKVDGEAFPKVSDFSLFVIDALGNKTEIETKAHEDSYSGYFTPTSDGVYTVVLNNNKIDVIDYTKYNFGVFKTYYHSVAKVTVGDTIGSTAVINDSGITIRDVSKKGRELKLQVLFKNIPLVKNGIKIFVADQWSKTLETDEKGMVSFKLPWNTKYIIEASKKEEVPGNYKGLDYEFIWHCATYTVL